MTILDELLRRQRACRGPGEDLAKAAYTTVHTGPTNKGDAENTPLATIFTYFDCLKMC